MSTLFARHKFQDQAGNLPRIHAVIKINWDELTCEETLFVNNCIRASVLDIIKIEEMNCLIDDGLIRTSFEVRNIKNFAKNIFSHEYNPRCLVMVGKNKYIYRKPNYLKMNKYHWNHYNN